MTCLCVSTIWCFSHVLCIESGVFLCVLSMCVLSSRVCTLLCELFVLISSDKVLRIVCVMCVTLYSIERLCVFSMYVLMGFTLVELLVLLKSEGVFGYFFVFCPPFEEVDFSLFFM